MVRKALLKDSRGIYALMCEMEERKLTYAKFHEIFHAQCYNPNMICFVYEKDGQIVSMLNLRFESRLHQAAKVAEITELFTTKSERDQGYASELLQIAEDIAREIECTQLEIAASQIQFHAYRLLTEKGLQCTHFKYIKPLGRV